MPNFDLDDALAPTGNPFVCPECGRGLHVVRRYTAEDYAEVSEKGTLSEVQEFQILNQELLDVLCSGSDEHVLALTDDQRDSLITEFIAR